MIIPVHTYSGGGNMTDEDMKILLGMWIFCNILWVLNWLYLTVKFVFRGQNKKHLTFKYILFNRTIVGETADIVMLGIWGLIILFLGGWGVYKLFL